MTNKCSALISAVATLLVAGCLLPPGHGSSDGIPSVSEASLHKLSGSGPIQHIVVVIQENRSVDNLFNGFPGADTVQAGKNKQGQTVTLQPVDLTARYDLSHRHSAWVSDYDDGRIDGFNTESEHCYARTQHCPSRKVAAYGYVPRSEVEAYWDMAEEYTFADKMFQSNQGPSFPAHQYLISGTSAISNGSNLKASENASDTQHMNDQGGCNSVPSATVITIDPRGNEGAPVFPCFKRISIMARMDDQGVSWRYYQEFGGSGQWHGVDAIKQIWQSHNYANVIWPSSRVLKDIVGGKLANVTFVTPSAAESDHAAHNNGTGPSWVASIVNAVGESSYWNTTAVIVVWDDWGGWYDHVAPKVYDSYELGFRVPMVVISPYAKSGYVSHVSYEFGSILKFIEGTFSLESLGTTDVRANDLSDCFDFGSKARAFRQIRAQYSAQYFEHLPISYKGPDDDY
jgi:phospholipase C